MGRHFLEICSSTQRSLLAGDSRLGGAAPSLPNAPPIFFCRHLDLSRRSRPGGSATQLESAGPGNCLPPHRPTVPRNLLRLVSRQRNYKGRFGSQPLHQRGQSHHRFHPLGARPRTPRGRRHAERKGQALPLRPVARRSRRVDTRVSSGRGYEECWRPGARARPAAQQRRIRLHDPRSHRGRYPADKRIPRRSRQPSRFRQLR